MVDTELNEPPAGSARDSVFCICARTHVSAFFVVLLTAVFSLSCIKAATVYVVVVFSSP